MINKSIEQGFIFEGMVPHTMLKHTLCQEFRAKKHSVGDTCCIVIGDKEGDSICAQKYLFVRAQAPPSVLDVQPSFEFLCYGLNVAFILVCHGFCHWQQPHSNAPAGSLLTRSAVKRTQWTQFTLLPSDV